MALDLAWIRPEPQGIYLPPADAWIDPAHAVARALVTHGHADHARGGHGQTVATAATLAIMGLRYGVMPEGGRVVDYGGSMDLDGGIRATFVPAGHVLGSAQILLERDGQRVVVTGDYKRRPDPTCAPFEVVPCDVFITEATFGLPVFRHPPIDEEIARLREALAAHPQRCVLVGAYALGKAQRLIAELRRAGHDAPIFLHGAMERMCGLYREWGIDLGDLRPVAGVAKADVMGHIVVCPPSALNDRWSRRLPDPITAMASGWMRVRQRARQRNVELPLVISDHADWDELTATITQVNPAETWITHGREEALLRWCALHQRPARALALVGYEDEDD
ncbi:MULTISPECIES: ligase-associated DNA damage response exonuclease [unclassified Novosphingobium]|uniref:ligase-associated DNA damage response exonuclease n=1 Tax=unclassified Novosphingobium TaxID=2644732 RepID=UPI00146D3629|nr:MULTISPECIES: ligase-associated DNA damage response exonuclease [unclassified Novosphingobium]NMN05803.1 putative mRNA 3-end processing factor [Novosphingobium sp. SG919]NMN87837.1 putative mRNA 3-end processing factor [Novosphingobium sp. SG916]